MGGSGDSGSESFSRHTWNASSSFWRKRRRLSNQAGSASFMRHDQSDLSPKSANAQTHTGVRRLPHIAITRFPIV